MMTLKGGCHFSKRRFGGRISNSRKIDSQESINLKICNTNFVLSLTLLSQNGRQFETYIDTMVSERAIKPEY